MRDVTVAGDLVRGIDHNHALAQIVRKNTRDLAKHRRLANAGTPEEQHAAAGLDDVTQDLDRSVDRAADAQRKADDFPRPIAQRADAVKRAFDAGAVVAAELTDV